MEKKILPELKVEDTLKRWPQTIPVFLKYRMACVGCSMSSFETISGAAEIYKLPLQTFIDELQQTITLE
jgi:hybrid cluster-associated redox disulfide protein